MMAYRFAEDAGKDKGTSLVLSFIKIHILQCVKDAILVLPINFLLNFNLFVTHDINFLSNFADVS